jgi:hypothetical protein
MTQPEQIGESRKITVESDDRTQLVERLRSVLASKNLNVNTVSKETERIFDASSAYFIPHNFCYNLATYGISPHVCQVLALSRLTGYSFSDLLTLFGFPPDEIPRLQLKLHRQCTVLLPSVTYDKSRTLPYLGTQTIPQFLEYTGPCAKIASKNPMWAVGRIEAHNRRRFLYVRIGSEDAMAFPELAPGSIVRVDPLRSRIDSDAQRNGNRPPIYLIEHQGGLVCCQASLLGGDRLLLTPPSHLFESMEFKIPGEAAILGRVDAEIHPLRGVQPTRGNSFMKSMRNGGSDKTTALPSASSLSELLRYSRKRIGLNFRQAHELSEQVAIELNDPHYVISQGLLCDLEATNSVPHHIAKILSFCILYCLDLWSYLRGAGIPVEEAGHEPLPRHLLPDKIGNTAREEDCVSSSETSSAEYFAQRFGEIPTFLNLGFSSLLPGLTLSARELYWVGCKEKALHPLLEGAFLMAVETTTRGRRSEAVRGEEPWERPLYLLLLRDGRHLCGFCSFTRDSITLIPHPICRVPPVRFSNGQDAEVVGQVTAVARVLC